jgi:hypothetical protein
MIRRSKFLRDADPCACGSTFIRRLLHRMSDKVDLWLSHLIIFAYRHPEVGYYIFVLGSAYDTKKAQVPVLSAHPGITGLRIAHITQDRQRQLAHARTNYI